jgi:plastocyanin
MLQERPSRTRQYRSGRARPIALGVIALCCGLAFRVDPAGLQLRATGVAQASETRDVTIDNYTFSPGALTVPVGTTVTWANRDFDVHTVTADDTPPTFKSAGLDTDDSFSFTFNRAGTYSYHCSLHPHMTGKIVVQ